MTATRQKIAWALFAVYAIACMIAAGVAGLSVKSLIIAVVEICYMLVITLGITWRRLAPLTRKKAYIGNAIVSVVVIMFAAVMLLVIPHQYASKDSVLGVAIWVVTIALLLTQVGVFIGRPTAEKFGESQ